VFYIGNIPYAPSISFIKIALLFQYLRIFPKTSRRALFCKILIGIVSVWGIAFSLFMWIPCIPLAAYWDMSIENPTCWGFGSRTDLGEFMRFFISHAITTSCLDFIVFVLPIHLYFKSDATRKTRIALLCLFVLGLA
jgi:hypothetical protein